MPLSFLFLIPWSLVYGLLTCHYSAFFRARLLALGRGSTHRYWFFLAITQKARWIYGDWHTEAGREGVVVGYCQHMTCLLDYITDCWSSANGQDILPYIYPHIYQIELEIDERESPSLLGLYTNHPAQVLHCDVEGSPSLCLSRRMIDKVYLRFDSR